MIHRRIDDLRSGRRVLELDGLRGIAVAVVVVQHYLVKPPLFLTRRPPVDALPQALRAVVDISWCGVDLFFVLSGFLIGGILLDHREAPNLWRAFYARRIFRIFPAYFLLLLIAFLPFVGNAASAPKPTPFFAYALFIQNFWTGNGYEPVVWLWPVWTLAIEEQFYIAAPLLIARLSTRRLLPLLGLGVVGPFILRCVALFRPSLLPFHVSAWDFTLCRVDGISMGVLAAWVVRQPELLDALWKRRALLKAAALVFAVGVVLVAEVRPWGQRELWILSVGLSLLAALSVSLILGAVLDPEGWWARVLRTAPLTATGKHSYFIYLFHMVCLILARMLPLSYWGRIGASVVCLGVLSSLSWRWFEMPLIRMGHRVTYESPDSAEAPTAVTASE